MAGSKAAKGAAAKAAEAKRAKDAAAAAAAAEAEADVEDWVVDMTTPVELDAAPPARKPVAMPALPPLPDGEETDEARAARVGKDAETIKRAKSIRDGRAVLGAKISSGPPANPARKSHWDYVLIEMRWMANDFAAERDWKAECARRCGSAVAAAKGVPKPLAAEDAETTKKRACARVAAEVAAFWSKAWDRATKKPIPTAAQLVPPPAGEAEGAGAGAATTNGGAVVAAADLSKTDSGRATRGAAAAETTQAKTTPPKAEKQEAAPADVVMAEADGDAKANGGDAKGAFAPADSAAAAADVSAAPSESDFQTPMAAIRAKSIFPKTPPPPPGVKVIEQWACTKLVADIARLKRGVIRDAMREKEEEEEGDKKGAKKGAKKGGKGGGKKKAAPTRGRRGRSAKDESEEEEEEEDEEEEEEDARAAADGDVKPADATTTEADVVASAAAAAMPPPPPVYLPGGVPDAILDAELNLASVAPGTPPRVDEDPHAFPPVAYECYGTATTRWWTRSIGAEAMKFAEYERRLRDWEESEKRRQRAVVDAARFSAEAEEYRRAHERRRAVAAAQAQARAAAAAAGEFDEYDAKGKRKMHPGAGGAKRARTGAAPTAEDSSDDEDDGVTLATLQKKGKARDKKKSHKAKKRAAGTARPWTPVEDQLLCAIVHEFGSNWGLITDVFAASAPFKGVYRRAEQCRWRFQALTQSAEGEGDPNAMAALNLNKGSARQTMSRALPVEDNTARLHFDRAAQAQARHVKLRRQHAAERAGDDLSRRAPAHQSWNAHRALQAADPLELADQALMEAARAQQAQQQQRRHQMGGGAPGMVPPGGGGMPGGGGVVGGGMGPPVPRRRVPAARPGNTRNTPRSTRHSASNSSSSIRCSSNRCRCSSRRSSRRRRRARRARGRAGRAPREPRGRAGNPRPAPAPSRRAGWGRRTRPRRAPPRRWRCPRCPWRGARARGRNRARRRVWRRGCGQRDSRRRETRIPRVTPRGSRGSAKK